MPNKRINSKYNEKESFNTYDAYHNNSNKSYNMSESDIETLLLLRIQILNIYITIYAYIVLYASALQGIELIYNKYINNTANASASTADGTGLQSIYMLFLSQLISTKVAVSRYNILYKEKQNGKFNYSLEPNRYIIISNLISIISYIFLIIGAQGIYARDAGQTILGV